MTKPLILLIGGHKESGKDTVSDYYVQSAGFTKLGMSDTLAGAAYILNPRILIDNEASEVVLTLFKIGEVHFYQTIIDMVGYTEAKSIEEVRIFLQNLGTEVGRKLLAEDLWVDIIKRKIDEAISLGSSVAVTGIRFPNELALETYYGDRDQPVSSIWVDRPSVDKPTTKASSQHSSEASVSFEDFEFMLTNDSSKYVLYDRATDLLNVIRDEHGA